MILASLMLFPVLANAQVGTSNTSTVVLEAKVLPPAPLPAPSATNAVSAAAVVSSSSAVSATHPVVREFITTSVSDNFLEAALTQGGTLDYILRGSLPQETSAPKLTRAVEMTLTDNELSAQPSVSDVAVRVTVDQYGIPRNLTVIRSAGKTIDARALEAVSQYRFKPATVDNIPAAALVTIDVKIQKQ
jgi:TonB family protein